MQTLTPSDGLPIYASAYVLRFGVVIVQMCHIIFAKHYAKNERGKNTRSWHNCCEKR